jgi:GTP-binding protein
MFRDEINIRFKSGRGGDGHVSFGIDKKPDGGIGGDGGSIYVEGAQNEYDLSHLKAFQLFEGGNGEHGGKNHIKGATGKDVILKLPLTTQIYDLQGNLMMTIDKIGERKKLVNGGRGGLGNHFYKKAHGVDLYRFTHGNPGEELECKLKLELYSDVIFIGLPNAGKSSVLREVTNADAKVGAYPFTTLIPQQGRMDGLTLMDLPGLIEGTHYGKGVGTRFVKHTKSARLIAHFISSESQDIKADYKVIREEIEKLGDDLSNKKEVIILTKKDLVSSEKLKELEAEIKSLKKTYTTVSVYDLDSLDNLRDILSKHV